MAQRFGLGEQELVLFRSRTARSTSHIKCGVDACCPAFFPWGAIWWLELPGVGQKVRDLVSAGAALVIGNTRIRAQESSGLKRSNATYNSKVPERTGGGVVSAYHGQGLEPYIQYGDWPVLYKPPILILCAWRNAHLNCSSS